jgi:hypothetical protein
MINVNFYNFKLTTNAPCKTEQLLKKVLSICNWRHFAASNLRLRRILGASKAGERGIKGVAHKSFSVNRAITPEV